jgi:spore coat polysaccharide biosynthesis predicted glycosyltransferase SpsG
MLVGNDILDLNWKIIKLLCTKQKIVVIDNKKILNVDNKNIKILHKVNDEILASYMTKVRIAITTASMSLYELPFLKVATITIAIKENQQNGLSRC